MTQYIVALAQQTPAPGGGLAGMLVPMLLIFGVMYLLVIRPQSKKAKEKREMLSNLKNGDEVVTSGGVIGRISRIDGEEVTLMVSEGVRFRFKRSAVTELLKRNDIDSRPRETSSSRTHRAQEGQGSTGQDQVKAIHIYIEHGPTLPPDAGLTIVRALKPNCLSQRTKPKIILNDVDGSWPGSGIVNYALGNLFSQGITPTAMTNAIQENGSAFGRSLFVIYLMET